jgi:hypothetical protein
MYSFSVVSKLSVLCTSGTHELIEPPMNIFEINAQPVHTVALVLLKCGQGSCSTPLEADSITYQNSAVA